MIALVHLDPWITGPVALGCVAGLVWYWIRLGRDDVPPSRRRLRRISLIAMLVAIPNFLRGLSLLDPEAQGTEYFISWSMSLLLILTIFITACLDALLTFKIQRRQSVEDVARAGRELAKAARGATKPAARVDTGADHAS